jgi:hypothetical protein
VDFLAVDTVFVDFFADGVLTFFFVVVRLRIAIRDSAVFKGLGGRARA